MKSVFALSLIMTMTVTGAYAQEKAPPQAPTKPTMAAATILDKYIEASGGKAAYAKIKSSTMKATVSVTAQNLKGTIEIQTKAPNKYYAVQTFDQIGKTTVGFDGKTGWSKDPIQGLRVLAGKELAQMKEQAVFNSEASWRQIYTKVETIGIRKVDGKDTYAVRLTRKSGKPTIQFYDTQTFLIVRTDSVQESAQGSIPVESYLSDYRTVDGVKVPFKLRQRVGAAELVTEVTEVKNNVPVPESVFAKPAP